QAFRSSDDLSSTAYRSSSRRTDNAGRPPTAVGFPSGLICTVRSPSNAQSVARASSSEGRRRRVVAGIDALERERREADAALAATCAQQHASVKGPAKCQPTWRPCQVREITPSQGINDESPEA